MTKTANPPDYSRVFDRLCHLVALSRDVGLDSVIDSLLLSVFVVNDDQPIFSPDEVQEAASVYFGIELSKTEIISSIDRLLASGRLSSSGDGAFLLPLHVVAQLKEQIESASQLEIRVRDEWLSGVVQNHPQMASAQCDELWAALKSYMAKAFHRHGAETIRFLDPRTVVPKQVDERLSILLERSLAETLTSVPYADAKTAIRDFFKVQTTDRTKYLAQLLDGTFTFFALSADDATSEFIRGAFQPTAVFLDTNFIFGLLNLHINPMVEVSQELVSFINDHGLPFQLCYHASTLHEMECTISFYGENLLGRNWIQSVSRAAVRSGQLSGLELRYHELNQQNPIDPQAFMDLYRHPRMLLEGRGFTMYVNKEEPDPTIKAQYIAEYQAFIESRRQPKQYSTYDHDMTVWLAVQSLRGATDSIIDCRALFLTCDYHLYVFDEKMCDRKHHVGSVVMPNHLLQMLRPFAPATDDFNRRFVETFSIPEFRIIGSGYSATTSKVLSYLATFSSVPEEIAARILADELLIGKLNGLDNKSEEFKSAVDDAVMQQNEKLTQELEIWRSKAETGDENLQDTENELENLRKQYDQHRKTTETEIANLKDQMQCLAQSDQNQHAAITDMEKQVVKWRAISAVSVGGIGLTITILVPIVIQWPWLEAHPYTLSIRFCAALMALAIAWAIGDPKHRRWSLGGLGIGAILVLAQVLGK